MNLCDILNDKVKWLYNYNFITILKLKAFLDNNFSLFILFF